MSPPGHPQLLLRRDHHAPLVVSRPDGRGRAEHVRAPQLQHFGRQLRGVSARASPCQPAVAALPITAWARPAPSPAMVRAPLRSRKLGAAAGGCAVDGLPCTRLFPALRRSPTRRVRPERCRSAGACEGAHWPVGPPSEPDASRASLPFCAPLSFFLTFLVVFESSPSPDDTPSSRLPRS